MSITRMEHSLVLTHDSALNIVPENGPRPLFLEDPNGLRIEIHIPAGK